MVLVYAFKAEHVQASSLKYLLGTCWHIFLTLFMWLLFMNIEKISYYQNNLKLNQCKQKKQLWAYANYFVNIYPQNKRIERG
jgi:hypothetical protein